jgi:hypothetical protein
MPKKLLHTVSISENTGLIIELIASCLIAMATISLFETAAVRPRDGMV